MPDRGQLEASGFGHGSEKLIGDRGQDTGAISRVFLKAAAASVIHTAIEEVGVLHDLMARFALNVGNKSNTASILLERGVVEPLL